MKAKHIFTNLTHLGIEMLRDVFPELRNIRLKSWRGSCGYWWRAIPTELRNKVARELRKSIYSKMFNYYL